MKRLLKFIFISLFILILIIAIYLTTNIYKEQTKVIPPDAGCHARTSKELCLLKDNCWWGKGDKLCCEKGEFIDIVKKGKACCPKGVICD